MRSTKMNPERPVFKSAALIFGLCMLAPPVLLAAAGETQARVRIETGRDLQDACAALARHHLAPQTPTPRDALFCRQFLMGYFGSLRYLHDDERLKRTFDAPSSDPLLCINIDGPRSYDQLAQQVVRTGEWNPQLMDEPAVKLAQKTFSDRPPC